MLDHGKDRPLHFADNSPGAYGIIQAQSPQALIQGVTEAMRKGMEPLGGVAIALAIVPGKLHGSQAGLVSTFVQAMVPRPYKEPTKCPAVTSP